MINHWNERYSAAEYAYGTEPNEYLKQQLTNIPAGNILFPAEGEGRNAVFAASIGWHVTAFDQSTEGQKKAFELAAGKGVSIDYLVGEFSEIQFPPAHFDAIALIYAHFPAATKLDYHKKLSSWLKPGGLLIFEAFSKKHLSYRQKNPAVGGPDNEAMLFSIQEITESFSNYEVLELIETTVNLQEGLYHNGEGSVIRFTGRKK
jgi:ubiquinone/menaquinone biosynthesis C-methylase UbiE